MGHVQLGSDIVSRTGSPSGAYSEASGSSPQHPIPTAPQAVPESLGEATESELEAPKQQGLEDSSHHSHRSGTAALIGLCIGVVLLVVSGCLFVDRPTEQATPTMSLHATMPPSTTAPPTTAPRTTTPAATSASGPPASRLGFGVALGKVVANDGTTLVVKSLTGSTAKVRSNTATKIYVFDVGRAGDIRVGTVIVAYGQTQSDRSIMANVITGVWVNASAK